MREITITQDNLKGATGRVWQWITELVAGGAIEILLRRPSKSRQQEKLYHALIKQIVIHANNYSKTQKTTLEGWKALLVYEFEKEKALLGEPLTHRGYYLIASDGERIYMRPSTTLFRKREAQEFIEFIYAKGVEMGVIWSANEEQIRLAHGITIDAKEEDFEVL